MALFGGSSISDGSKATYLSKLKNLNDNKAPTDVAFLKNTKSILEKIALISNPNTRRSSIIAVVSVLKDNKKFIINALNISSTNLFQNNPKLNNSNLSRPYIKYEEIMSGGTLNFQMTNK